MEMKKSKLAKLKMPMKRPGEEEDMDMMDMEGASEEPAGDELDHAMAGPDEGEMKEEMGEGAAANLAAVSDDELLAEMKKRGLKPEDLGSHEASDLDMEEA